MNKAIFLDRDGTINQDSAEYIKSAQEFDIFPFAFDALKILQNLNYFLIIITNQSGIARGLFSQENLNQIHEKLRSEMQKQEVEIDDIFVCPHHPDEKCKCRKPLIENIDLASNEYDIDLEKSWFIGDSQKDIITGFNAGCKTILVLTGIREITVEKADKWEVKPDYIAKNLLEAAKIIRKLDEGI